MRYYEAESLRPIGKMLLSGISFKCIHVFPSQMIIQAQQFDNKVKHFFFNSMNFRINVLSPFCLITAFNGVGMDSTS